jgi:hypothetical protein
VSAKQDETHGVKGETFPTSVVEVYMEKLLLYFLHNSDNRSIIRTIIIGHNFSDFL